VAPAALAENMATTVITAFNEFMANTVNLDPAVTTQARGSRDSLITHLHALPTNDVTFPLSFEEHDVAYGSFSRRTKIRPLDDIDLVSCMSGEGSTYAATTALNAFEISVPDGTRLRALCHDHTNKLNSRKVINRYIQGLSKVPQYRRAEIRRDGEAAVLELTSRTWSFDIVPGFFTKPEANGRTYYLIPDGGGNWKKTDPRLDQENVTRINAAHGGHVLNVIRAAKYWNRRPTMTTMPPYAFECMVLDYYRTKALLASEFVDLEIRDLLPALSTAVWLSVWDPKGIQGDLNTLTPLERLSISTRARDDAAVAVRARTAESAGDHATSIRLWREIFGSEFPAYG
jgi:hypothetical protein